MGVRRFLTCLLLVLIPLQGCAPSRQSLAGDPDNAFVQLRNERASDHPIGDWLDDHKAVKYTGIGLLVVGGVVMVASTAIVVAALTVHGGSGSWKM